jgi:hypothetical protein
VCAGCWHTVGTDPAIGLALAARPVRGGQQPSPRRDDTKTNGRTKARGGLRSGVEVLAGTHLLMSQPESGKWYGE